MSELSSKSRPVFSIPEAPPVVDRSVPPPLTEELEDVIDLNDYVVAPGNGGVTGAVSAVPVAPAVPTAEVPFPIPLQSEVPRPVPVPVPVPFSAPATADSPVDGPVPPPIDLSRDSDGANSVFERYGTWIYVSVFVLAVFNLVLGLTLIFFWSGSDEQPSSTMPPAADTGSTIESGSTADTGSTIESGSDKVPGTESPVSVEAVAADSATEESGPETGPSSLPSQPQPASPPTPVDSVPVASPAEPAETSSPTPAPKPSIIPIFDEDDDQPLPPQNATGQWKPATSRTDNDYEFIPGYCGCVDVQVLAKKLAVISDLRASFNMEFQVTFYSPANPEGNVGLFSPTGRPQSIPDGTTSMDVQLRFSPLSEDSFVDTWITEKTTLGQPGVNRRYLVRFVLDQASIDKMVGTGAGERKVEEDDPYKLW